MGAELVEAVLHLAVLGHHLAELAQMPAVVVNELDAEAVNAIIDLLLQIARLVMLFIFILSRRRRGGGVLLFPSSRPVAPRRTRGELVDGQKHGA